jgi:hypothetical protein
VLDFKQGEEEAFEITIALLNVTALRNLLVVKTEIREQQDVLFRVLPNKFLHEKVAREAAGTCNDTEATACEPKIYLRRRRSHSNTDDALWVASRTWRLAALSEAALGNGKDGGLCMGVSQEQSVSRSPCTKF